MNLEYILGIIVGICIAAICIAGAVMLFKEWKKGREEHRETGVTDFDERQELVRGKGFRYGFLTLLIYSLIMCFICLNEIPKWFNFYVMQLIGMGASLLVFGTYCIWNEAYVGLRENRFVTYLAAGGIGGVNLLEAIMDGMNGKLLVDGRMTNRVANLVLGILFTLDFVLLLLRNLIDRRRAE